MVLTMAKELELEDLLDAAKNGDTAAIQEWFSTGKRDPDEKNVIGHKLLALTASRGHVEMMRILLAHGASVHETYENGETALHTAARCGHHAATVFLLDHGAKVNARNTNGETPLHWATLINDRHCKMIRLFLQHGMDLDTRNIVGDTAEDFARSNYDLEAAALLANVRRAGGWRPYVRYPRFRLLMLRILAEQGLAETQDTLLRRLFPAGPPAPEGIERTYRAQKGGLIPRGIFMHIIGYWRSSRDFRF